MNHDEGIKTLKEHLNTRDGESISVNSLFDLARSRKLM